MFLPHILVSAAYFHFFMTVFEQTQGKGQSTPDKLQFITIQRTEIGYKRFNGFFFLPKLRLVFHKSTFLLAFLAFRTEVFLPPRYQIPVENIKLIYDI